MVVELDPQRRVVSVHGDMDEYCHDALVAGVGAAAEAAPDGGPVHLDLSEVTFLSGTGIRALVDAAESLGERRLQVDVASTIVARVLEVTALDGYFGLRPAGHG
jgi:anti-anti-sigma factor